MNKEEIIYTESSEEYKAIKWLENKTTNYSDDSLELHYCNILYSLNINLMKENKQLKKQYCERTDCSGRIKDSKKYDSLQQRIDKAIEYIENNEYKYYQDWGQDDGGFDLYLDENEIKQLKKILKGSEN